jgi:hypothetical protein
MKISKYLKPEWLEFLTGNEISDLPQYHLASNTFPDNTILKLAKHNGEIGEYTVVDCRGYLRDGQYTFIIYSLNEGQEKELQIFYKKDDMELPIITDSLEERYEPIFDINPEWLLQLSRLRLALAKSLNKRLGEHSLLTDVSGDIITSIGENIEKVVGERDLNGHRGGYRGGGKKKKRKSKRKKKKTKKRKSKRKKHKTKRRKS